MPILNLISDNKRIELSFDGTPRLCDLLAENGYGVISPCGGNGSCGKCVIEASGNISEPSEREIKHNCRLACQVILLGDAEVRIKAEASAKIEARTETTINKNSDFNYGAAIDIGTTTIAVKLFDSFGNCIGSESALNPQRAVADDVIGRISMSLNGKGELLKAQIVGCINELLSKLCGKISISDCDIERKIITGNTAMLYLLTGKSPKSISAYPFESETLFGEWVDEKTYLPHCLNAFVGADITCALLASGICEKNKTALLCDIGTNGEIALWKNNRLYVASASAGPAFEGACISCGCLPIGGAVDKAYVENNKIIAETVDDLPAIGICGSGLIDVINAFLKLGYLDKSGYCVRDLEIESNGGVIKLTQDDIRAVQLAKAAVFAGIISIMRYSDTDFDEIEALYLAGGFGNSLDIESAIDIGLIPGELKGKIKAIGNGALSGAIQMLFDDNRIEIASAYAEKTTLVELGGNSDFYEQFIKNIDFV